MSHRGIAAFATAALGPGMFALAALMLVACGRPEEAAQGKRPNIIYILADDLGYADVGLFGSEIPTPNLDELARGGMQLTGFYTNMTCSPTRAMFMSGVDSHLSGLGVMGRPTREDQQNQPGYSGHLNFDVASLADLMTDAGYNTYMVGKWHLGDTVETGPHARGFKRVFASFDGAAHLGGWDWRGPQPAQYWDNDKVVNVSDNWYTTRDYTKKMIEYIDQDRAEGKPFFAWVAYTAPHWPLQAPKESIARFKGRYDAGYEALYLERFAKQKTLGLVAADAEPIDPARFRPRWNSLSAEEKQIESRKMEIYAAMVSDMDTYVGELVAYLKEIGEYENTLIVFSSDNGAEPGRRDLNAPIAEHIGKEYDHSLDNLGSATSYVMYGENWASAGATPWNRHKFTAFEGGVHVPAFVHQPGKVPAGTRSAAIGTVLDLMPTFLEVAGAQHPGAEYRGKPVHQAQGVSLLPVWHGSSQTAHAADAVFGWELSGYRAVRQGDWKLVWDHAGPAEGRRWYLFNLAADPLEQNDRAAAEPDRLRQMLALWERFDEENRVIY